jgi:tRNA A-37 threonylcarbamoyl transferase component Bud32
MLELNLLSVPKYLKELILQRPDLEQLLDSVHFIRENNEGYTGFVFEVGANGQNIFLKQFRNYKKKVPHLRYYPESAESESKAILRFSEIHTQKMGRSYVPKLIHYDSENYVIIMSDVSNEGVSLYSELNAGIIDLEIASKIGCLMGVLHSQTFGTGEEIRDTRTEEIVRQKAFDNKCSHIYTVRNGRIQEIIQSLKETKQRSLIYGDLFPNNIAVGTDRNPYFYDFTVARNDDPAFELGYCCAHYILMMMHNPLYVMPIKSALESLFISYRAKMDNIDIDDLDQIEDRSLQFVGTTIMYNFTRKTTDKYVRDISKRGLVQEVATCAIENKFNNISDIVSALS